MIPHHIQLFDISDNNLDVTPKDRCAINALLEAIALVQRAELILLLGMGPDVPHFPTRGPILFSLEQCYLNLKVIAMNYPIPDERFRKHMDTKGIWYSINNGPTIEWNRKNPFSRTAEEKIPGDDRTYFKEANTAQEGTVREIAEKEG